MKRSIPALFLALLIPLCVTSCRSVYYNTMEKFGMHKRDILVDRVKEAKDSQEEAKQQFRDALEAFTAVVEVKGGKLEAKYERLRKQYERCESRADEVRDRIHSIETVARALFKEWRSEIKQYSNPQLQRSSQRQYDATIDKYDQLIESMNAAASRMDPVLIAFRDQVLFLKHNLNSRAIASIQQEADKVEADVARLVSEMEASIAEADAFIKELGME